MRYCVLIERRRRIIARFLREEGDVWLEWCNFLAGGKVCEGLVRLLLFSTFLLFVDRDEDRVHHR